MFYNPSKQNQTVLRKYLCIQALRWVFCCGCLVAKSRLTLCNPMVGSPPGSSVRGVSQAVSWHFLLQRIFLPQGWNLLLLSWQMDSLLWATRKPNRNDQIYIYSSQKAYKVDSVSPNITEKVIKFQMFESWLLTYNQWIFRSNFR